MHLGLVFGTSRLALITRESAALGVSNQRDPNPVNRCQVWQDHGVYAQFRKPHSLACRRPCARCPPVLAEWPFQSGDAGAASWSKPQASEFSTARPWRPVGGKCGKV